ncbi:hypothetical protein GCM10022627_35030 [Haloarcula argentinensis]
MGRIKYSDYRIKLTTVPLVGGLYGKFNEKITGVVWCITISDCRSGFRDDDWHWGWPVADGRQ